VKHQHGGNLTLVAAKYGLDPEKIMDFSVNVNPLGPPEGVKTLVENWVSYITVYPEPYCDILKEEYASRLGTAPENLIFSNGAVELIYMLMQALRPRTVLIPGPTFSITSSVRTLTCLSVPAWASPTNPRSFSKYPLPTLIFPVPDFSLIHTPATLPSNSFTPLLS
jgi:histidinol-phosphate/aromatic aminotransferase/cobyric acid decarboxylase-like protein